MNFPQKLLLTLAAGLMTSTAMAQAREDHKAHHPDASASAASAVDPKAAPASAMAASGGMHGHMSKQCKEIKKIMSVKDPAMRQKAMDAHMKEGDCDMMKDGMGGTKDGAMGADMGGGMKGEMKGSMGASSSEGGMQPMGK